MPRFGICPPAPPLASHRNHGARWIAINTPLEWLLLHFGTDLWASWLLDHHGFMPSPHSTPELQSFGAVPDTQLERTLREQQILLDSAGVGIVFMRQRVLVRCNQRYAEIFGYASPQQIIGLSSEVLYPSREEFRELGRSAYPTMARGQTYRVERQMRRCNGELFWGNLTGRLINPLDTTEGSIWILDDIDEQKRAQAQLSDALREKQLLFDHAMVGIVFLRDRHLTRCNRHFEQMLGYAPGELAQGPSRRWYASDAVWEDVGRRCYPMLAAGQAFEGEVEMCRKDGTPVVCEMRSKSLDPDDPSQGSVWIAMDVTERKQAQAALAMAHERLEQQVQDRTRELRDTVDSLHSEIRDRKADQERIYWLAHYDPLTGLPNRRGFEARAQAMLAHLARELVAAVLQIVAAAHLAEVRAYLAACARRLHQVQPVARRARALLREDLHAVAAGEGNPLRLVTSGRRPDRYDPAAFGVTFHGGSGAPRGLDFHRGIRLGPAPQPDLGILLKHHVVADDFGQPDFSRGAPYGRKGDKKQEDSFHNGSVSNFRKNTIFRRMKNNGMRKISS